MFTYTLWMRAWMNTSWSVFLSPGWFHHPVTWLPSMKWNRSTFEASHACVVHRLWSQFVELRFLNLDGLRSFLKPSLPWLAKTNQFTKMVPQGMDWGGGIENNLCITASLEWTLEHSSRKVALSCTLVLLGEPSSVSLAIPVCCCCCSSTSLSPDRLGQLVGLWSSSEL